MIMLTMLVTGCETATSGDALCTGLSGPVDALVDVVVLEGSDAVVLATEAVVVKFDAGCQN